MTTKDIKYLTEMKELPPEADEGAVEVPKKEEKDLRDLPEDKRELKTEEEVKAEPISEEDKTGEEKSEKKAILSSRDIMLGVVNLIFLSLLIFILFQFPQKAEVLKELRTEEFLSTSNTSVEFDDITRDLEKSNEIQNLFLVESGLVDFVNEVEKLKSEDSSVQRVSFAGQLAIKDRTGNFGIPLVIELTGNWESIDRDLQKIDKLPFLFRVANVNIEPSELDPAVVEFKYGLFLYVDDKLGQTR